MEISNFTKYFVYWKISLVMLLENIITSDVIGKYIMGRLTNIGRINNGWYLILENITSGYGNHKWNIEFITSGEATSDKFNISQVMTITTSDISNIKYQPLFILPILASWTNKKSAAWPLAIQKQENILPIIWIVVICWDLTL